MNISGRTSETLAIDRPHSSTFHHKDADAEPVLTPRRGQPRLHVIQTPQVAVVSLKLRTFRTLPTLRTQQ